MIKNVNFKHVKKLKLLNKTYTTINGEDITDYYRRLLKIKSPELSLEQVSYNNQWPEWFTKETNRLKLSSRDIDFVDIQAIGSASIPGMSAKNIIDIAAIIEHEPSDSMVINEMALLGYQFFGNSPISPDSYWFWKIQERVSYVLHLSQRGSPSFDIAYLFRDYLKEHPQERRNYSAQKKLLADQCDDLFSYSIGKTDILCGIFSKAEKWQQQLHSLKNSNSNCQK